MDRPLKEQMDSLRIPLWGNDNQRQYSIGGTSLIQHDNVLLNCFAEQNPETSEWVLQKRQGLAVSSELDLSSIVGNVATCIPRALISLSQVNLTFVAAIADTSNSKLYIIAFGGSHGTGVKIGEISAWGTGLMKVFLTEAVINGSPDVPYILVNVQNYTSNLSVGYYAATTAGAFTASSLTNIADVDYPGNISGECAVGPFVQLNQHIFIMGRSGKVYNSDQNSISSWNVRGVQPASIEPDLGIGLAKYKQHIVAFGDNSTEFFEDAGLAPPGGPLQRTEQAQIKFGCINSSSFVNIDDTIYWLATSGSKITGLWKLDQYTPVKVSTPWVDNYIYPLGAYLRLNAFYMGGRQHLAICGITSTGVDNYLEPLLPAEATYVPPSDAETEEFPITVNDLSSAMLIWDMKDGSWWGWSDETIAGMHFYSAHNFAQLGLVNPHQVFLKLRSINLTAGNEGSKAYQLYDGLSTQNAFWDEGYTGTDYAICTVIQGQPIEFVTEKRKFISKFKLICDAMTQFASDTSVGNRLYLLYDRKDGLDGIVGNAISRSISIPSDVNRYYFNRLGSARKFFWAIVTKSKMNFRARAIEIDLAQGTG